jgi:glycosyltransferase involved in cell wall biosynthesis
MGCAPTAKRRRLLLAARLGRLAIGNSMAGLAAWRIPSRKARLVPNGFDPRRLQGLSRRSGRGRPFTVVMAGSMSGHKDFATLIRAAEELGRARPGGFRLVLPGDGPDRGMLAGMAAGLHGTVAIEMPGRLDEILPLLAEADAGVLLSPEGEGMSNAIMEYMASGLPVVCTGTGGNSELVREGVDGFLVPPGDHSAVAASISTLASDPLLSESMGMSGRSRIMTSFSAEEMVSRTLAVYAEARGRSR